MENVLYSYHFDIIGFLPNFIGFIVGGAFLFYAIKIWRDKTWNGWRGFIDGFFGVIGFIVGPLAILISIVSIYMTIDEHFELKECLVNDKAYVVEGYVENYHPMPYDGHDTEHFEIDGVYFEFSDFTLGNGYHRAASHGGVVTKDGQHLKIKYVIREVGDTTENVILYIAETEPQE